ncbi:MAG: dihydroorotate dehydrogenase electron transfer subunit [Chloroflexi bacterium]|nr:dihydroorotate dehydrogenase electron transfer subunit [Chloroflexota bacterium]
MNNISATVLSNKKLCVYPGATYFLMRIQAPEIAARCKPGQFLMLKCGKDTLLRRPISVHSVIDSTYLELLYALPDKIDNIDRLMSSGRETEIHIVNGMGTRWLSGLTEGCSLDLIGPSGNSFTIDSTANKLLLIAGGIGIAPLRFLAEFALSQGKEVTLLLGARTESGIIPDNLLPSGINVVTATEDGSRGKKGTVIEIVPEYIDRADQVFACGPKAMYQALENQIQTYLRGKDVQVSLEVRMGCGTGVCYSCSIRTKQGMKRVCKEGPVFNIRDIIWQEVRI